MKQSQTLDRLQAGQLLVFGGNRTVPVSPDLAEQFRSGDSIYIVESTEEVLHIPAAERRIAEEAIGRAEEAFTGLASTPDQNISAFYSGFAGRLADESTWSKIQRINEIDVVAARNRNRSTTRLVADEKLRTGMIEGLRGWINAPSRRGQVLETVSHDTWQAHLMGDALGIVGFIFEGRPNVLADATGVLRGGNAVVFRIGSDALQTARGIMAEALIPALVEAGLPAGSVSLVESSTHSAGWALFSDSRLSLAVARGSGPAVATLGSLAQQAGVPVSLHGTGGAWMMATAHTQADTFEAAVIRSLDRKVCNTLNVCCLPRARADVLIPRLLSGLTKAGERLGQKYKLHVVEEDVGSVPAQLFETEILVRRAEGDIPEMQAQKLSVEQLGHEWEWEQTPEISLKLVDSLEESVALFNQYSSQFVACLISDDSEEQKTFYESVNAPFVGDGYSRWVDGQFALNRPELGLSNWQGGRLFGRGGILSGDTVYTVRTRATGTTE
ncbi:MAG: aldehyde dehydrogenase family protein [Myxococcota bacterium]|nr:aldehyde dehydrogenase family protein [Myxococcota bacterium]